MQLRISEERLEEATVVRVAGRLVGEGVEELSRTCTTSSRPLHIDLSGLLQVDEIGLSLLRALRDSGAVLSGVSPFIQMLIENGRDYVANK